MFLVLKAIAFKLDAEVSLNFDGNTCVGSD